MKNWQYFFLILIFAGFIFLPANILALEAGALGIRPTNPDPTQPFGKSWFIYTAEIGKEIKDQVDVVNLSDVPIKAKVWAADAATTPDGAYTIKEEARDIGTWITFYEKHIEDEKEKIIDLGPEVILDLEPNQTKTIDFILIVPENAEVGDYMGAIMVQALGTLEELKKEEGGGEIGAGIKIVTRVGARVYLTIPGEIVRILEFPEFWWEIRNNRFYFLLGLKNKGNVRIEPKGKIVIKNILGTKIDELKIPQRVVFPKDEITLPVEWEKLPFWVKYGGFVAEARVIYGPGLELIKEVKAVALPWYVPAALGGIILIGGSLLLIRIWLRRKERKKLKEYIVKRGETIEIIAGKFEMNWKKLAKINKLKPPYVLKKGQRILVLDKHNEIKTKRRKINTKRRNPRVKKKNAR